jgi:hypothetical protein
MYQMTDQAGQKRGLAGGEPDLSSASVGLFRASVEGQAGTRTSAFVGRPVAASDWKIEIYMRSPDGGVHPDMDPQQLNDIELSVFTTYQTRKSSSVPPLNQCEAEE